ncbi:MAG: hypothetical protein M3P34_06540 [Actinomycetota bacterium]|nr:hypothetical protein [Actinomycetota bacterium]
MTRATTTAEAACAWSDPLSDPTGSKVASPPGRYLQLRFEPVDGGDASPPYPARWERVVEDGLVITCVWDQIDGNEAMIKLAHVPGYGTWHRLVVAVPPALA